MSGSLARRFSEVTSALDLPVPGRGETAGRLRALFDVAVEDIELAKLVEADADARAIAAELDFQLPSGTFGVWALAGPGSQVRAEPEGHGWVLSGRKQYCTGAGIVSHALVPADSPGGPLLLCIGCEHPGERADYSVWKTAVFSASRTATISFDGEHVASCMAVGGPGQYLNRPGFWGGALSVAACWAGGASGLIGEYLERWPRDDPHSLAHAGALRTIEWELPVILEAAGRQFDRDPADGFRVASIVRHRVEQLASEAITRVLRAGGPGPLALDEPLGQRIAGLQLFLRQHHAERDLESLARAWS